MPRVLMVVAWIAVVVYALADWYRTPEGEGPARLPRSVWLLIIVLTIPTFAIGAVAWIVLRVVARAEARQRGQVAETSLFEEIKTRLSGAGNSPSEPVAPDDDPEFLQKLQRDIARQRARERDEAQKKHDQNMDNSCGSEDESSSPESPEFQGKK